MATGSRGGGASCQEQIPERESTSGSTSGSTSDYSRLVIARI
jgi:hypothetical protein